ncbi:hypothetical protein ACJW30_12G164800 [Castanea mollissima]
MENDFFLNPALHFEQPSASIMPTWRSLSAAMEIQIQGTEQSQDCFFSPNTDQSVHFDSALSSMVSSPAASTNNVSNDSFVIRELIGKLGNIGNNSANNSCYSTPLNSPPKQLTLPMTDHLVKENLPSLGKSMPLNSSVAEFSADPGFAERAARFSRFGSRSFNGRTGQLGLNNAEFQKKPNILMANGNQNLPRVSSSPSLKANGSQMGAQENKNSSPLQDSQEESTISEQNPNGDSNSKKRKAASRGKKEPPSSSPSANATKVGEANDNSKAKRSKPNEDNGNENGPVKAEDETQKSSAVKTSAKPPEPPKDYIHVRARRGQATDSHSLAERVRREKISERMKLLQDLVPGCNKVTGKALMLDEIINYVQSLQRQVEFLSMKLASVNTKMDASMDSLFSKDIFQSNNNLPHPIFPLDSSASAFYGQQPQQNPALHSNISNGTVTQCSVDPIDTLLCQSLSMQLLPLNGFSESVAQLPNFGEDDLQTIVQMGLGPNPSRETVLQPQSFHGSNQAPHMKVEQ